MFEAALAALEVAPEQALMIGDSPREDIAGAAALGIQTVWLARGRAYPSDCPAPTRMARDVREALGVVLSNR